MTEEQRDNIRHAEKLKHISTAEDARYIRHHAKSVELIQYSDQRGMSRQAMRKIWSDHLINMVLGHEEAK